MRLVDDSESVMAHRILHKVATRVLAVGCLLFTGPPAASAQVPLSDVEVRLVRIPPGGCIHCDPNSLGAYEVKIHGDGTVEYHNAEEPEEVTHIQIVSTDDVIALANAFIEAGFFGASEAYQGKIELVRKGDGVALQASGVRFDHAPEARLTLRIGDRFKEVSLVDNYPVALGRLPALVDRIGGPAVWAAR